ncbi:EAL domain-containing protein [Massilia sp. H-1]|nr:EAL domain-containing protein [Massilia sp. H-1]
MSAVRAALPLNIAEAPRTADEWAKLILRSLEQRWVRLASFPVLDLTGRVVHRESALRLMFGGEWFPAARFLPIAERLGLTTRLDLVAVTLGLEELARDPALPGLAVNLSARSVQDKDFRHQLLDLIAARPAAASRLWLEVPESGVFAQLDAFRVFCDAVRWSGCKLGIEHFGRHFKQISLVHDMALHYVKVDGSFVRDVNTNASKQPDLPQGLERDCPQDGHASVRRGRLRRRGTGRPDRPRFRRRHRPRRAGSGRARHRPRLKNTLQACACRVFSITASFPRQSTTSVPFLSSVRSSVASSPLVIDSWLYRFTLLSVMVWSSPVLLVPLKLPLLLMCRIVLAPLISMWM